MECSSTVADLLRLRRNCRYGLSGLKTRHLPTGRIFVCRGSEWSAQSELMLYVTEGSYAPVGEPKRDRLGIISAENHDRAAYTPGERVPAAECVLLERWPVVCCRPSRRRR